MIIELQEQREAIDSAIGGLRRLATAQSAATALAHPSQGRGITSNSTPATKRRHSLTAEQKAQRSQSMREAWEKRRRAEQQTHQSPSGQGTDYEAELAAAVHDGGSTSHPPQPEIPAASTAPPHKVEPSPPAQHEERREEHKATKKKAH